jgi:hypothetical protein
VIVIAPSVFLIGLPLTLLLERHRLEREWVYPVAGFIAGPLVLVALASLEGSSRGNFGMDDLPFLSIGAVPGAASGAIWWWAYRRHVREQAGEGRGPGGAAR